MVGLLAGVCLPAAAEGNGNAEYGQIAVRNIFDLHGLQALPSEPAVAPAPDVRLCGITTILGDKKALFTARQQGVAGNPAAREESYILSEGQSQGGFEVVEVNLKLGTVKLNHSGKSFVVALELPKSSGRQMPPSMPPRTPVPPPMPPMPPL